jgi:hypothetical protein
VYGIKRHIAVDTQGLPHAIHIQLSLSLSLSQAANITDREGAYVILKVLLVLVSLLLTS